MSNGPASPAPTPSSRPEQGYRQRLNNWLQSRGIETSTLTREGQQREFEGRTIWTVVYRFDGTVYGEASGATVGDAGEEAARIALRSLLWEAADAGDEAARIALCSLLWEAMDAGDEAARTALRNLLWEAVKKLLQRRSNPAPS